jgi:para-aminobenzoate synthetase component 1
MKKDCIIFNGNDGNLLVGLGIESYFEWREHDSFKNLDKYLKDNSDRYVAGFIGYDFKNQIEDLSSLNFDGAEFPELLFWAPESMVEIDANSITTVKGLVNKEDLVYLKQIQSILNDEVIPQNFGIDLKARTSESDYLNNVKSLQEHIQQGNIYEVNYCQEYYAEHVTIDSFELYKTVNKITAAPFSIYFSIGQFEGMCGSPERYIQKEGNRLISQPIKGTIKRGKIKEEDEELKKILKADPKEQSENVMIVDLVRNDLSKIATKGSVKVDELFGIYSFNTVHQMISTISCEIEDSCSFSDMLQATFPMGSMTGAPKISAMHLIEEHEEFKRGLYSGSIGLITPEGDYDFNVVIRSLLYNSETKYLSCGVGGAITHQSIPEKEYEECEVKIGAIKNAIK